MNDAPSAMASHEPDGQDTPITDLRTGTARDHDPPTEPLDMAAILTALIHTPPAEQRQTLRGGLATTPESVSAART